jgi:4-diphosphocytidyl-2-C-methyl-D-erythritol kinase
VTRLCEPAPAKLNLALHVRGRLPDGRHAIETLFAFCTDGDVVYAESDEQSAFQIIGPMQDGLDLYEDNLVVRAAAALQARRPPMLDDGASLTLDKRLPVASGLGGGSADAAATLRLLTRLWAMDPTHASELAPTIGDVVPACLLIMTARGTGAGDALELVDAGISGTPVLLVNPRAALSTAAVFAAWDGVDRGPLGDWREGRNDLEAPARALVPATGDVIGWLAEQPGATFVRMSGSGATCFALFDDEDVRDAAASACPASWWHLATYLR